MQTLYFTNIDILSNIQANYTYTYMYTIELYVYVISHFIVNTADIESFSSVYTCKFTVPCSYIEE